MFLLLCQFLFTADDGGAYDPAQSPPSRQVGTAGPLVEMTPGQAASVQQAQIKLDMFFDVFGEDQVKSWQLNWDVFQNPSIPFDDSQKRLVFRSLTDKFEKFSGKKDQKYFVLLGQFTDAKQQIERVHKERLQQITQQYFIRLFQTNEDKISIQEKKEGVQLGLKVRIQLADKIQLIYHVKTHGAGRLQEKSTVAKTVDPKELFTYKLLEILGIGPEVHFLQRSPEDVYIATLDAGMAPKSYQQRGQFLTFECWKKQGTSLPKLMGCLSTIKFADLGAVDQIESAVQSDKTSQQFMRNFMKLDLLSRILQLSDTTTNSSNFGFNSCQSSPTRVCLLDFRVPDKKEQLGVTDKQVGGFLQGNGDFNYDGEHSGVKYTLRNRADHLRVCSALEIMHEDFEKFQECINEAHQWVASYIVGTEVFQQQASELKVELDRYKDAVTGNFNFFKDELEKKLAVKKCAKA